MSPQYRTPQANQQEAQEACAQITSQLELFLAPLLIWLDAYLDKRLVRTFVRCIAAIITFRNRGHGLNIAELGSYLDPGITAAAGAKRLHTLLGSTKWGVFLLERFVWERAKKQKDEMERREETVLCIWDGSVLEKPESEKTEGFCAVKSSKAKRLRKQRKGVFNKPGGKPIVVKGLEWIGVILVGKSTLPCLVAMRLWSRKGEHATTQRKQEEALLWKIAATWGRTVLHVFDRGYASGPWLQALQRYDVSFVIRWKKKHNFFDQEGNEKLLSLLTRYKRSVSHKDIWDAEKKNYVKTGIVFLPLWHASYAKQLWVVVVRRGGEPWYLITNTPVETEKQAWDMYWIYRKRWKIETCFRYEKSELAMESVRLFDSEKREKLLFMVTIVYAFLLSLLQEEHERIKVWLLYQYCHRTGKKYREKGTPVYRLRWALSRFWHEYRPTFDFALFAPALSGRKAIPDFCSKNPG
jgi:hypothetical protein